MILEQHDMQRCADRASKALEEEASQEVSGQEEQLSTSYVYRDIRSSLEDSSSLLLDHFLHDALGELARIVAERM
jgi:hypothetical protein